MRAKEAKAWTEAHSSSEALEAAGKLCEHLRVLQHAKIGLDARAEVLEVYRPFALGLLAKLDSIYGEASPPLDAGARTALESARSLARRFRLAYSSGLEQAGGWRFTTAEKARREVGVFGYRAMEFAAAELRASYRSYTSVPRTLWQTLHNLNLFLQTEGVVDESFDEDDRNTVQQLYCSWLLVSIADPYRMRKGELDKVLDIIRTSRAPVFLGQGLRTTPQRAHFLVPSDLDKPPKPLTAVADRRAHWWLLDANPIVEKLRERKRATRTTPASPEEDALLSRLIAFWGDPPRRGSSRDPMETTVAIAIGLAAAAHFISFEGHVDTAREAEAIRSGLTLPLLTLAHDAGSIDVAEWEVINQSASGLKVRRPAARARALAVGQVAAIKFAMRDRWSVGITRWITETDQGDLELGLQLLAAGARTYGLHSPAGSTPVLVLEGDAVTPGTLGMVAPAGLYADLRAFEIDSEGERAAVRAMRLIERSPAIDYFEVIPS